MVIASDELLNALTENGYTTLQIKCAVIGRSTSSRISKFGVVWLTDGSWLERYEYDGAENWELKKLPTIPVELRGR